ncbi:MAG: PEGA domain-containing protein [Bacteroidales bacterium]|nr:PEGA domain-containing protein [Bacteroidales bacterium]
MRKYIVLIVTLLLTLNVKAQLVVEPDSFKEVPGFVILDHDKTDINDVPFAVIKIRTRNIDDSQRRKLTFGGNLSIDTDIQYKVGEVWLYLTYHADYIKISHPDFSSTEFTFPYDMKPNGCYELTLVNNSNFGAAVPVKQQYNYLIVKADQPDAAISFDGQFVNMGEASKSYKVGETHTWSIECELYHPESGSATIVKDNAVTVEKTLRPAFGFINITSTPESGATVFVDNKKVGTTPFKTDRIASGEHKVRVMKEMYSTAEKTVTVTDGNTTQAAIALSANFVNATVTTDPDSDIYIDSELKGKGRWTGRLSDGSHTFEARKASHKPSFKNVTLTIGKDENITISNPEPIYGTLDVNSSPMGATITIDGRNCGTTPKVLYDVLIGNHELRLEKSGCAPVTKTITLDETNLLAVNEKLPTGREISISTDRQGDEIYCDGNYLGVSPLTATLSFGSHSLKAVRDSKSVEKTVTVAQTGGDSSVRLAFKQEINGHEYVDLGLPSGLLWATCNVGASRPEDYGNYYAWGETATKSTYDWSTYRWCRGSDKTQTKYNTKSDYGTVDNRTVLEMSDDAARANWGGDWRMPTTEECRELKDECTWTWTTQGGKNGYCVTGPNGGSIFLPAAGYRSGTSLGSAGSYGYYWSSSLYSSDPLNAYGMFFISVFVNPQSYPTRYDGQSVRPVRPAR